jgi:hypothetical protein
VIENGEQVNSRVIAVAKAGRFTVDFSAADGLNIVAFASQLPNGDTLITDSGNNRIVEFDPGHKVVFEYFTNKERGQQTQPLPTNAVRPNNGSTLLADQFNNNRVLIVSLFKRVQRRVCQRYMASHAATMVDHFYTIVGPVLVAATR